MPGIVLGGGNLAVNNSEKIPGVYILVREKSFNLHGVIKNLKYKIELFRPVHDTVPSTHISAIITFHFFPYPI